jgi:hypothetical protein
MGQQHPELFRFTVPHRKTGAPRLLILRGTLAPLSLSQLDVIDPSSSQLLKTYDGHELVAQVLSTYALDLQRFQLPRELHEHDAARQRARINHRGKP